MSTLTGSATEPTSSLTVPTVGGDTDTWGTILNGTSLQALLDYILWLYARATDEEVDTSGAQEGDVLTLTSGMWVPAAPAAGGSGDVTGPASSTAGNFPDFDDTTGKVLGDSGVGPGDFATAAQGALADSAVQPGDDAADLGSGAATDGHVLTSDGAGGAAWEPVPGASAPTQSFIIACSDETTDLTTGAAKVTFRMPFAFTLTAVRASVTTAPTDAALQVDINEGGVSILSTVLSIDSGEKTSTTAATPAVISDSSLADDAEITIDIDQVGSTVAGAGLKVALIGTKT